MASVFYSNPQRLDVYVNNQLVVPTNAEWNIDKTDYTLKQPIYTGTEASHTQADNVAKSFHGVTQPGRRVDISSPANFSNSFIS